MKQQEAKNNDQNEVAKELKAAKDWLSTIQLSTPKKQGKGHGSSWTRDDRVQWLKKDIKKLEGMLNKEVS